MAIKLFHLLAVIHFYFGIYYQFEVVSPKEIINRKYSFGGQLVYLTILNFIFQAVYFTIALVNDFVGSNESAIKERPLIRKVRDYVFGTFAVPLAFDVGGMFWLLYAIDRELVLPKSNDAFFPSWFNHILHTNIMVFILFEMIFTYHKYPCRKSGLSGLAVFMLGYLAWVHVIWFKANAWVYPVLAVLNWPQRIAFYAFTLSVPIGFYYAGEFLNKQVWNQKRIGETPTGKKSKSKSKSRLVPQL